MATTTLSATGTNDHTAINTAITNATAGDTIFLNDGTYDLGGQVSVTKALTFQGQSQAGVILKNGVGLAADTPSILINGVNNVTFKTLTVDGNGIDATNASQCIAFQKCDGVTITDVTIKDARGHTLMLYSVKTGTITRLTTTRNASSGTGTSHGVDIDVSSWTGVNWTAAGTTVTATINGHNVLVDDYITVVDSSDANVDGSWQITAKDATTITFVVSIAPAASGTASIGRNTSAVDLVDCDLDSGYSAGGRQSMKAESVNDISFTGCTFRSEFALADNVTISNCGVLMDDCTFDAIGVIWSRTSTFSPTIQNSTFTRDGGMLLIRGDSGAALVLTDNTWNGRNRWLGYNGTTWTSPSNVTETGSYHPGADTSPGKTMFASYNDTGNQAYNTAPYVTPHTARNNFEDLCEDTNLDEATMHYAMRSDLGDNVLPSDESNITLPTNIAVILEGYPDTAVVNVGAMTADWLSVTNIGDGSICRKLHLKGGRSTGQQAFFITGATWTIEDVTVEDYSGLSVAGGLDCRGNATAAANVTLRRCVFDSISSSGNPGVINVQAVTNTATVTIEACRFIDCTCTGAGIVRVNGTTPDSTLVLRTTEFIRCTSGTVGVVYNQDVATVNGCTFVGNTATNEDDITSTTALAVKNCIFEDAFADIGGAGAVTITNCLSAAAITYDAGLVDGGNNLSATAPGYVDANSDDYNLTSDSAAVGAGVLWWTAANARPEGYNGEPFPDLKIDIGANQSTHDAMHPANL